MFTRPRRRLIVLGSTGTIGLQALALARAHPELFSVVGVTASSRAETLAAQVREFAPAWCAIESLETTARSADLQAAVKDMGTRMLVGTGSSEDLIQAVHCDIVINAISGLAGLVPALAALERGVILGMANKEPLVVAGTLLRHAASAGGATLIPVDSEPAGVRQCLSGRDHQELMRVYLTASGGPFWGRDPSTLAQVSVVEALSHPRWRMGRKITIDSATMFNKGLEAIEISKLFNIDLQHIGILVHPQSVTHALVEFTDGSMLAQMGPTDMRGPISQAMFWPELAPSAPARLSLAGLRFDFSEPDLRQWPCLDAALSAGRQGGLAPAAVSAADEVLVEGFLNQVISFGDIGRGLWATLEAYRSQPDGAQDGPEPRELAAILRIDNWARSYAAAWIRSGGQEPEGGPEFWERM